jgi:hypothetical protein
MRTILLIASTAATLLAGVSFASAWDDPPGWRFQDRANREANGEDPYRYRSYGYYGAYGSDAYAYAPGAAVVVPAPGYYGYGYRYRHPGFGFRMR